jgi:hypothetical protein
MHIEKNVKNESDYKGALDEIRIIHTEQTVEWII